MREFILLLFTATGIVINSYAQDGDDFHLVDYYHSKVMDDNGHLDSWHRDENGPFEFILNLSAEWWKNPPDVNGWPIWCTAALVDTAYIQNSGAIPGSACSSAIIACLRYYVFTGDTSYLLMARRTGDYVVRQDLTSSDFARYPNFPYATGSSGNINPQGYGHPSNESTINPIYSIQPDKGAMLGVALLELYKVTVNPDSLNTSINIANCLSDNAIVGSDTCTPWPMRVMADDGSIVDGVFSANISYVRRLFDELLRIGLPGNGKYKVTRDSVWDWFKTKVIPYDDASKWLNFFEDTLGDGINFIQIDALGTARY